MSRSLSHEVGILTLGRLVSYAVMFVVPLVNVRTLSVEEYGYYRQFWLILETLTPILILGFPRSLLYYLPRAESRSERSAFITQTVLFLVIGSLIAIGIYALMARFLGEGLGGAARGFFWRLCTFTFFMVVTEYMEVLFVAQREPVAQSVYHASLWGVQSLVVIAASYFSRDVSTIIWSLTLFGLVRFLFAILYTHRRYGLTTHGIRLSAMREQASFAVPVGLAGIALMLVSQTDKFIINRFMGREAFAIYSVGAFQLPLANIIQSSIGNVTFPLMARYQKLGDHESMIQLWRRSLLKTVVLFFPLFVFMEVTARPFITILFTEQYADATPVFMIYMLLFLRSSVETGTVIQVSNKTMFLLVGFLIGFVVNVGLGILLFHTMGRLGVPLSALLTMTALSIANIGYSARLVGTTFSHLFPTRQILIRLAAALVPGIVMWLLYRYYPVTNVWKLAGAAIVYAALYAVLVMRIGLITRDDLKSALGRNSA